MAAPLGRVYVPAARGDIQYVTTQLDVVDNDDLNYALLYPVGRVRIVKAWIEIINDLGGDTNVVYTLEKDDGTTETTLASLTPADNGAEDTRHDLPFDNDPVIDGRKEWVQLRCDNDGTGHTAHGIVVGLAFYPIIDE